LNKFLDGTFFCNLYSFNIWYFPEDGYVMEALGGDPARESV